MRKFLLPNKNLVSPKGQGADFVELFFDLVFVYAITRVTFLTAHHLDFIHILQSALVFWLLWWGWTQFTWALNATNTQIPGVRVLVLIATGVAFVMASSVDVAFGDGVIWFAASYVLMRIIGLILYLRASSSSKEQRSAVTIFALASITGLIAVIAGAFVDPSLRIGFWIAAVILDLFASTTGAKNENWNLHPMHFAERHGLIIIIALGESLIVAATAVSGQERSFDLMIVGMLAVLTTCMLWWSYFSWISEYLEEQLSKKTGAIQAGFARDVYSFLHFLIICGIIGVAVSFEKILQHPHDVLTMPVAFALGIGYTLFIGISAIAVWRATKIILLPRLIIMIISLIGVVLTIDQFPVWALVIVSLSLGVINVIEWKKCKNS